MSFDFLKPRSQQETGDSPKVQSNPQSIVDMETESASSPTSEKADDSSGWDTTTASFLAIAVGFVIAAILSRYLNRESDIDNQGNGLQSFWRF